MGQAHNFSPNGTTSVPLYKRIPRRKLFFVSFKQASLLFHSSSFTKAKVVTNLPQALLLLADSYFDR